MQGYWNNPEKTARAITPEGWFTTGDAAQVDQDGIFDIVDRWKDMYISGGENAYHAEVESVLYQHPEVVLASVVGVPHERWGETGSASRRTPTSSTACPPARVRDSPGVHPGRHLS